MECMQSHCKHQVTKMRTRRFIVLSMQVLIAEDESKDMHHMLRPLTFRILQISGAVRKKKRNNLLTNDHSQLSLCVVFSTSIYLSNKRVEELKGKQSVNFTVNTTSMKQNRRKETTTTRRQLVNGNNQTYIQLSATQNTT